jgi:hypothetical protein
MTNQQHPITLPPELVQQWDTEGRHQDYCTVTEYVAYHAAQWSADQELLACGNYLKKCAQWEEEDVTEFYNYRRPKPPSLKEQALELAKPAGTDGAYVTFGPEELALIRRALEDLPE